MPPPPPATYGAAVGHLSPSAPWNRPYKKQTVCVPLATGLDEDPPVLYPDGGEVGAGYVVPRDPRWNPHSTEDALCIDQPGCVRIDRTEVIPGDGLGAPDLWFHKGGQGYAPPRGAAYGHVAASVLAEPPEPRFTKERLNERGGDPGRNPLPGAGRAHPHDLGAYLVRPRPIGRKEDGGWLYKPRRAGARYSKYGDAGPVQGEDDQHFAYLCWSWVRQDGARGGTVSGGGAVRALLKDGQLVHRCAVESLRTPAWNLKGRRVGWVVAIYVRLPVGDDSLYGWIVHSHVITTPDGRLDHVPHVVRADE